MSEVSALMAVKVLSVIVFGVAFFWWQMHDLAQEKKRAAKREAEHSDKAP